jgi:hypothetical protein
MNDVVASSSDRAGSTPLDFEDECGGSGATASEQQQPSLKKGDFKSAAVRFRNVARMRRIVDTIRTAKKEGTPKTEKMQ